MTREVFYSPAAYSDFTSIYEWIEPKSSHEVAHAFVMSIFEYCEDLCVFPFRGVSRADLAPGLRIVGFKKRVTIAFVVSDSIVEIHGIFYGGRDVESDMTRRGRDC